MSYKQYFKEYEKGLSLWFDKDCILMYEFMEWAENTSIPVLEITLDIFAKNEWIRPTEYVRAVLNAKRLCLVNKKLSYLGLRLLNQLN